MGWNIPALTLTYLYYLLGYIAENDPSNATYKAGIQRGKMCENLVGFKVEKLDIKSSLPHLQETNH